MEVSHDSFYTHQIIYTRQCTYHIYIELPVVSGFFKPLLLFPLIMCHFVKVTCCRLHEILLYKKIQIFTPHPLMADLD